MSTPTSIFETNPGMHAHALASDDRRFRTDFEQGHVAPAQFDHAAHVRLAYVYLAESTVEAAIHQMRKALLGFLQHHAIDPSKFHETLTQAWILAVRHFMDRGPSSNAADFVARYPDLLDGRIMLTHYSSSALFSADARKTFVEPDLDPIPLPRTA